jgi:hypothetical protein
MLLLVAELRVKVLMVGKSLVQVTLLVVVVALVALVGTLLLVQKAQGARHLAVALRERLLIMLKEVKVGLPVARQILAVVVAAIMQHRLAPMEQMPLSILAVVAVVLGRIPILVMAAAAAAA